MRSAIFDLDNTLIDGTSGEIFSRFLIKEGVLRRRAITRIYLSTLLYSLRIHNFERVVEQGVLTLKGMRVDILSLLARRCVREVLRKRIVPQIYELFEAHRKSGSPVAIASGSSHFIVRAFGEMLSIPPSDIISVRPAFKDGIVIGIDHGPLCYGRGKKILVLDWLSKKGSSLEEATFYSDNLSDLPLFESVREPIVVRPSTPLKRIALQRGWKVIELDGRGTRQSGTLFDFISKRSK